jgi:peptidoglycan/LPS O-acetylase OafA/YrhL
VLRNLSLGLLALFLALWIPFRLGTWGKANPDLVYLPFILSLMLIGSLCRKAHDAAEDARGWFHGEEACNLWGAALPWLTVPVTLLGLPIASGPVLHVSPLRFGLGHLLGIALFTAAVLWRRRPPAVFLAAGLVSYSLYLFHGFAIDLTVWIVEDWGLAFLQTRSFGFCLAFMVLLAWGIATLTYFCVEKPSIALGRRVSGRFGVRKSV